MASTDVVFSDEARAKQAIHDVRANERGTNWALFTYSDAAKNTLEFVGGGTGGVEELKTHLSDSKASYGLVRVTDKIDNSVTVKFVLIVWVGEKVPFVKKAQVTTHKGSVTSLIGQSHNEVHASTLDELTEDIIMAKVTDASGTSKRALDTGASPVLRGSGGGGGAAHHPPPSQASPAPTEQSPSTSANRGASSSTPKITSTKQPGVPQGSTNVNFIEPDEIRAAIQAVRSDRDETDWMLMGYEGNTNQIKLVAKGSGDLDELITHLKDDQILYGLYRTTDTIDNTVAVKFVMIVWVGEKVPIIRKARITTHKGEVTSFLGQYHVDVHCSNHNEINEDIVKDLVQRASGTANLVKK